MPFPDFKCKRCGLCCNKFEDSYHHEVHEDQVEIWRNNAPHILEWVEEGPTDVYNCWIDPYTGDFTAGCPWLSIDDNKGARCKIHKWKPNVCRDFPKTVVQALDSGCRGYDHLSEERLKQLLDMEESGTLKNSVE